MNIFFTVIYWICWSTLWTNALHYKIRWSCHTDKA